MIWLIEMIRSELWAGILLPLIRKFIIPHVKCSLLSAHLCKEGRHCQLAQHGAGDWDTRDLMNTCGSAFDSSEPITNDTSSEILLLTKAICSTTSFMYNALFTVYSAEDLSSFAWANSVFTGCCMWNIFGKKINVYKAWEQWVLVLRQPWVR